MFLDEIRFRLAERSLRWLLLFLVSESGLISRKTGRGGGTWGSPSRVHDNDKDDETNENVHEDHDEKVEEEKEEKLYLPLSLYASLFRFVVSTARTTGLGRIEG